MALLNGQTIIQVMRHSAFMILYITIAYDCTDPLHTYLGLCGLSLNGEKGLRPVNAALNISQRAADWLDELHARI